MAFYDKEIILETIDKNKSEKIQLSYAEKNNKKYYQLTTLKVNSDQEWKPIGGMALPVENGGAKKIAEKIIEHMLTAEEPKETV